MSIVNRHLLEINGYWKFSAFSSQIRFCFWVFFIVTQFNFIYELLYVLRISTIQASCYTHDKKYLLIVCNILIIFMIIIYSSLTTFTSIKVFSNGKFSENVKWESLLTKKLINAPPPYLSLQFNFMVNILHNRMMLAVSMCGICT